MSSTKWSEGVSLRMSKASPYVENVSGENVTTENFDAIDHLKRYAAVTPR